MKEYANWDLGKVGEDANQRRWTGEQKADPCKPLMNRRLSNLPWIETTTHWGTKPQGIPKYREKWEEGGDGCREKNTQGISTEMTAPLNHERQEKGRTQRERSQWGIKIKQGLATCSGRNHYKLVSMETDDAGWEQVNGEGKK